MINGVMAYFYLHDRLGSVRQIIDTSGNVKNRYTYRPFGESYDDEGEVEETITNPFKFTGQYFDAEIDEYYLRARQYDPHIGRFTSRDPVFGKSKEPMTLHVYLYCLNNPINRTDLTGEFSFAEIKTSSLVSGLMGGIFRGYLKGARAAVSGKLGWKGVAASGGIGFLEGFGFGFLSGGIATFSAQGFMWLGLKESLPLYFASGAIGGGSSGAIEGALEVFFGDANFERIQERAIAGLIGGSIGMGAGYGASDPLTSAVGTLGVDQFAQECYNYLRFVESIFGEKDKK